MIIGAEATELTRAAIKALEEMPVPEDALELIEKKICQYASIGKYECYFDLFDLDSPAFWEMIEEDKWKLQYTREKWINKILYTLDSLGYDAERVPNSNLIHIDWEEENTKP